VQGTPLIEIGVGDALAEAVGVGEAVDPDALMLAWYPPVHEAPFVHVDGSALRLDAPERYVVGAPDLWPSRYWRVPVALAGWSSASQYAVPVVTARPLMEHAFHAPAFGADTVHVRLSVLAVDALPVYRPSATALAVFELSR
jgi:hypothetical protein